MRTHLFVLLLSILLLYISIKKYSITKWKGHLIKSIGILIAIFGGLLFYKNVFFGKIMLYGGYIIFVIGYFINLITSAEISKQKSPKYNFLYHPLFIMVSIIFLSVLFIAWGFYNFLRRDTLYENINGIIAIFAGIGFIIYAIINKRKSKSDGK
jgi:hypothetical protein